MPAAPGWEEMDRAVRRAHSPESETDSVRAAERASLLAALGLRRLSGGHHRVYEARRHGRAYCLKLYRLDGRGSAEREWCTLRLLAERGGLHAPRPVFFDPAPGAPALVTELIAGEPLGRRALTRHMHRPGA